MIDPIRTSSVEQPGPFQVTFEGPTGPYRLSFQPDHDEGHFDVAVGDQTIVWHVEVCERTATGWSLGGMTRGMKGLWGDDYWFEVLFGEGMRAEFSLQGLARTDFPPP
ncbi:MAG: hypothetical protein EPN98_23745 [Phenylobacterium sp.]|uniref:hypothetical protein n=1 Tax=Phenylobacterium sp. TaxID=1871053 RepID=UPI0012089B1B|nr:hypothetical protein [Phenylobacterium sp.]TAL28319.1 MAG: hypothetical protein EPN98_23745 [Phenylobacterium sp.]